MPQPITRDLLVQGPLAMVSIAYKNQNYIADSVFPILDKVDPKAKIARYGKGAWFRDEAGIRGPGGRAKRGGFPMDFLPISTVEFAFAKEVTDEDRRFAQSQFAPPMKPDQDAIEYCADRIDLSKERRVANLILGGTWNGVAGGADSAGSWKAGANNTFLADIRDKAKMIQSSAGVLPNTLILDYATYNSLKEEATILDKIKYTQRGVLTAELLAALLDLDQVIVGSAIFSTAKENKAGTDFTAQNVWEKNAGKGMGFLFYRPKGPGLKQLSAGYQARIAYEGGLSRRTTMWREAPEHQDVYEVAEETDIVQTGADCGYLWVDTYST